jgi:hypothetical protein
MAPSISSPRARSPRDRGHQLDGRHRAHRLKARGENADEFPGAGEGVMFAGVLYDVADMLLAVEDGERGFVLVAVKAALRRLSTRRICGHGECLFELKTPALVRRRFLLREGW